MIVRTEKVKERGISIGMFSRGGKATSLLNSKFRDKSQDESRRRKSLLLEDDFLESKDETIDVKTKEPRVAVPFEKKPSHFFQTISREQIPIFKREKTPDAGIYRPKFDLVQQRATFYKYQPDSATTPEVPSFAENADKRVHVPACLSHGITCDFKVRDLKKKIEKMRETINNSNVDVQALYNERIIEQKVYNLFKSPSLTLLQKFEEDSKGNAAMLALQQNPNQLIALAQQYNGLKQEMVDSLRRNRENLQDSRTKIPDRARTRAITPIGLGHQLPRPPLVKQALNQSFQDLSYNSGTSCLNETFHKVHKFESGTPRKLFEREQKKLQTNPYDITEDILNKTRPKTGSFMDFNRFSARKAGVKVYLNSSADYVDLNEKALNITAKVSWFGDMRKGCGRRRENRIKDMDTSMIGLRDTAEKFNKTASVQFYQPGKDFSVTPVKSSQVLGY